MKFADWKFRYSPKIWERDLSQAERLHDELLKADSLHSYLSDARILPGETFDSLDLWRITKKSALADIVYGSQGYAEQREAALMRLSKDEAITRLSSYITGMRRAKTKADA